MNRDILILDGIVADKIAAGEVIERPASVVKELVENAIDAGSRRIAIDVTGAGKARIQVTDDGSGIPADQAPLAFSRHATSKIKHPSDLSAIRTLGFRGEALPSIASVARVQLITHTEDADQSVKVEAADGQIHTVPWHAPKGTDIVVSDLFYNTPARQKFLKSDTGERRAIIDYVTKAALAHADIAFSLVIEGTERITTPGTGRLKEAIDALFGRSVTTDILPVEGESPFGHVSGYVGKPSIARGNRSGCFVFINGRWVENRGLYVAVERGFDTLLAHRRFPFAVLHIHMDPTLIDVNVHPAKTEVRFRDERETFRLIMYAVRRSLTQSNLIVDFTSERVSPAAGDTDDRRAGGATKTGKSLMPQYGDERQPFDDKPLAEPATQSRLTWGSHHLIGGQVGENIETTGTGRHRRADETPPITWIGGDKYSAHVDDGPARDGSIPVESSPRDTLLEAPVIGQLANTYLLVEVPGGLWLIDQHVAHERLLYEEFLNTVDGASATSQELLAPERLTMTPVQAATFEEAEETLKKAGFVLEPFGGNHYLLRAVPITIGKNPAKTVMEMIDELSSPDEGGASLKERAAASYACRAAVKAGQPLQPEECAAMVRSLADLDNPFACPHGRPIIAKLTHQEISRRFGRS